MAEVYQIAFDVSEVATQAFIEDMRERLYNEGRDMVLAAGEIPEVR